RSLRDWSSDVCSSDLLATMGLSSRETSLFTLAKDYIKRKYAKPGNVYLGVVSRLDAAVSGVVLFARTSKAAARLSERFRQRDVEIGRASCRERGQDAE